MRHKCFSYVTFWCVMRFTCRASLIEFRVATSGTPGPQCPILFHPYTPLDEPYSSWDRKRVLDAFPLSLSLSLSCLCLSLYFSPTLKCIFTVLGESLSFSLLWFATILVLLITELTSHALGLGFDFRLMLELSFETDSKLGHKYCAYALLVKQS
jgi:hypothetical protein